MKSVLSKRGVLGGYSVGKVGCVDVCAAGSFFLGWVCLLLRFCFVWNEKEEMWPDRERARCENV